VDLALNLRMAKTKRINVLWIIQILLGLCASRPDEQAANTHACPAGFERRTRTWSVSAAWL